MQISCEACLHFLLFLAKKAAICQNLRTFAAVIAMRRKISAYVLLAVFLPILVFSAIHVHETPTTTDATCTDCVHHNCHGHLTATASFTHDCVLCQFLSLPMLAAVVLSVAAVANKDIRQYAPGHSRLASAACGIIYLRGPPACFKE